MRNIRYNLYGQLKNNEYNTITHFKDNKRIEKTFKEFTQDVDTCIGRLYTLKKESNCHIIGILGPTSYDWMVLDHACVKGGFKSIGIPELYPQKLINEIIRDTKVDILFLDETITNKYEIDENKLYYFNCNINTRKSIESIEISDFKDANEKNLIIKDYTVVFSSGTSNNYKKINWSFSDIKDRKDTPKSFRKSWKRFTRRIFYYFSFWNKKDNKVIIFMPFSHPINRSIVTMALVNKINIIISDIKNCIKHLIIEKPNIMFAVPPVYEAIAKGIKQKINRFSKLQNLLFLLFNKLKLNTLGNKNPLKRIFTNLLFSIIKRLYGGKADYFVTGSAPIDPEILRTFYSVGVKVYEAYGQTETSNIIAGPRNFKIGSVGKPNKKDVRISPEGEILLKYKEEYHEQNIDILNMKDGWIASGDLGYLDKKGYLFITGRKDELIVLNNGKKVMPLKIEKVVNRQGGILHSLAFSKDKLGINLIINCEGTPQEESIMKKIRELNGDLADYEKVKSFYITNDKFTGENGLLTSTFKIRREEVIKRYGEKDFISII